MAALHHTWLAAQVCGARGGDPEEGNSSSPSAAKLELVPPSSSPWSATARSVVARPLTDRFTTLPLHAAPRGHTALIPLREVPSDTHTHTHTQPHPHPATPTHTHKELSHATRCTKPHSHGRQDTGQQGIVTAHACGVQAATPRRSQSCGSSTKLALPPRPSGRGARPVSVSVRLRPAPVPAVPSPRAAPRHPPRVSPRAGPPRAPRHPPRR
ncbi:uncharacterized protein DKFZp434B061-like [Eriocheir sinensis]|uniref:uncharacterized protein DKFZp434B061-like n=1 Tax=Eriocheir sinensis TaxID=95602 RepID=UPI0021C769FC|nr:uncharacterized protein DKFZp434B061-like [Eriocheir sinensis]